MQGQSQVSDQPPNLRPSLHSHAAKIRSKYNAAWSFPNICNVDYCAVWLHTRDVSILQNIYSAGLPEEQFRYVIIDKVSIEYLFFVDLWTGSLNNW